MCGIIGYKGKRNASKIIIEGLKNLEYRGYDSWGIGLKDNEKVFIHKSVGKISEVNPDSLNIPQSNIGVGHSRWATHGGVSVANAHPHSNESDTIAVVHNGIIENFEELKNELIKRGHRFKSDTDTEVIVHLIEEYYEEGKLKTAVMKAISHLKGRYAIVVISSKSNLLIGARKGSPLILGVGEYENENEYFLASDIPAFIKYTNKVNYIDDYQMVVIGKKLHFYDIRTGEELSRRLVEINLDVESVDKQNYDHFMIKEILEQKQTIKRALNQNKEELMKISGIINNAKGVFIIGSGTSGKVGLAAVYFFSKIAHKHVNFSISSEFKAFEHFLTPETLVIVLSQSGETADVLEAMEVAKRKGSKIMSLVNVEGSSIYRASDYPFLINAGPEKGVAATKTATNQLALLLLIAYATAGKLFEGETLLAATAGQINDMLNPRYLKHIEKLADKIYMQPNIYIIGKAENYPMALESAIKIQEVSYIHAEGFASGELKHGPIALIDKDVPAIALVPNDEFKNDVINNAIELKARGAYVIGISPENNKVFDYWIRVPDVGITSPIVNIIPVQLLAYYLAIKRGYDPDKPRNLAKSVTVI